MQVQAVNNYNYHNNHINRNKNIKPTFCASVPTALTTDISKFSKEGKAVINYIKSGCPKTKQGEKIFNELFTPEIYDLHKECCSVETLLARCGDNLEVVDRALGKYGLELYGNLPQGSTTISKHKGIQETGYWSKYDDLNTNFINYLYHNPQGKLAELEERFGNHASMWLTRHEASGTISVDSFSYQVINDLIDSSSIAVEAENLRAIAIEKYLDTLPLT